MKKRLSFFLLMPLVALMACDPVPVQYPPGAAQYPYPNTGAPSTTPQPPEVSGSQRWQYAWNKAMEGVAMGGSIAGPYGAGGGLVIGLITGLITADSHYGQINTQIHTEQKKDQQLEAAIEQELARQRELDNQLAAAIVPTPAPTAQLPTAQNQPQRTGSTVERAPENTNVAALTRPPPIQKA